MLHLTRIAHIRHAAHWSSTTPSRASTESSTSTRHSNSLLPPGQCGCLPCTHTRGTVTHPQYQPRVSQPPLHLTHMARTNTQLTAQVQLRQLGAAPQSLTQACCSLTANVIACRRATRHTNVTPCTYRHTYTVQPRHIFTGTQPHTHTHNSHTAT